jgi:hypothetical protein
MNKGRFPNRGAALFLLVGPKLKEFGSTLKAVRAELVEALSFLFGIDQKGQPFDTLRVNGDGFRAG